MDTLEETPIADISAEDIHTVRMCQAIALVKWIKIQ